MNIPLLLLAFLVFASLGTQAVFAQTEAGEANRNTAATETGPEVPAEPFRNVVKIHPFSFVLNHLMLGFERRLGENWGLNLNAAYGLTESSDYYLVSDMEAFYVEIQPRFYLNGAAEQLFVSPYILFKTMRFGYYEEGEIPPPSGETFRATGFGVGTLVGYHFRIAGPLRMEAYMGGGLLRAETPDFAEQPRNLNQQYDEPLIKDMFFDRYRSGLALQMGFALGVDL